MNGWRPSIAAVSPQVCPTKKMSRMRIRLRTQISAIPPPSHSSLPNKRPRTMVAKAVPTTTKAARPFTPEQADATLSPNACPEWTTENSDPSDDSTGTATGTSLSDSRRAASVPSVKAPIQSVMKRT